MHGHDPRIDAAVSMLPYRCRVTGSRQQAQAGRAHHLPGEDVHFTRHDNCRLGTAHTGRGPSEGTQEERRLPGELPSIWSWQVASLRASFDYSWVLRLPCARSSARHSVLRNLRDKRGAYVLRARYSARRRSPPRSMKGTRCRSRTLLPWGLTYIARKICQPVKRPWRCGARSPSELPARPPFRAARWPAGRSGAAWCRR
jgi:hypothetical protein